VPFIRGAWGGLSHATQTFARPVWGGRQPRSGGISVAQRVSAGYRDLILTSRGAAASHIHTFVGFEEWVSPLRG
jgi:hypothetical protein